ncbi:hypothetical protein M8J77_026495 [Diaphorina citri]|nr:hypothetical protein M8J77_026495 [Diaphorina citri]
MPVSESPLVHSDPALFLIAFTYNFLDVINTKYHGQILCFTDGSKSENSTSCAYMINKNVNSFRLNSANSVFSAELIVILLCLQNMKYLPSTKFLLVTDSMSSLQAITSKSSNNLLLSKIYNTWSDLVAHGKEISFMWCPSHCGISGHEVVDVAAKNPNPSFPPNYAPPATINL